MKINLRKWMVWLPVSMTLAAPAMAGRLHLMTAPDRITAQMKHYCGSVAVDRVGHIACVTAPRGNLSAFWSVADGTYLASAGIDDGCGVTAATDTGGFLISSGTGPLLTANPSSMNRISMPDANKLAWDNHIAGPPDRGVFQSQDN